MTATLYDAPTFLPDSPIQSKGGAEDLSYTAATNPGSDPVVEIFEPEPENSVVAGSTDANINVLPSSPRITTAPLAPRKITSWTGRFPTGGTVTARYTKDGVPNVLGFSGEIPQPPFGFNLKRASTDFVAPGSLRFTLNGRTYVDRQGDLVSNPAVGNNAGTLAGYVNYASGWCVVEDWDLGTGNLVVSGLGLVGGVSPVNNIIFRTPGAPVLQGSLTVQAVSYENAQLIQATADVNGAIEGPLISGKVDFENGIVNVFFGEMVTAAGNEGEWWYEESAIEGGMIFKPHRIVPGTAKFSAVVLTSIPLDPGILGLDPILLPSDGRVPIFRPGDSIMAVQRNVVEDESPSDGAVVDLGINNVAWVRVRDANGVEVVSDRYTIAGPSGELTWANPLDLTAYTAPFTIESMAYFKRLCTDVQINGTIGMASGAPFPMAAADADIFLCSKLIFQPAGGTQDLEALALNLFTQASWTGTWSDDPDGSGTTGQYDDINFPIEMANNGSITERWRLQFTNNNTVNVIGETFGQVITGASIAEDIAPINPATGTPYFTIKSAGWSGGWQTGNVLRFNTLGANDPIWLVRSVQPGDAPELTTDRFIAHLQGDISQE